jgi:hypothetical protein
MRHDDQGVRPAPKAIQTSPQIAGIQGHQVFIQDQNVGPLQQGTGKNDPGAFALRQFPARITHELMVSDWISPPLPRSAPC